MSSCVYVFRIYKFEKKRKEKRTDKKWEDKIAFIREMKKKINHTVFLILLLLMPLRGEGHISVVGVGYV